jgi:hypothetical protein
VAGASTSAKGAGLVLVVPPEAAEPSLDEAAAEVAGGAVGWLSWRDLGALAVDLAEEADELRAGQAHRLVSDLQEQFPALDL